MRRIATDGDDRSGTSASSRWWLRHNGWPVSAERGGRGAQFVECLAGEFSERLLAGWVNPVFEGAMEGANSEVGGEARGQVRYAAFVECAGQGRGEYGALERRTFSKFGVVGDDRQEPRPEVALLSGEAGRQGIEGGGDRLKWRGRVRCGGDPVREQPGVDLLARGQDLTLVGEMPEEGGLGQPGSPGAASGPSSSGFRQLCTARGTRAASSRR